MAACWSTPQARTVADRRRLGFVGIVSVALAMTERGEIVGDLELEMTGIPETDADGNLIARLAYDAVVEAIDSMPRPRRRDPDAVAEAASACRALRRRGRLAKEADVSCPSAGRMSVGRMTMAHSARRER